MDEGRGRDVARRACRNARCTSTAPLALAPPSPQMRPPSSPPGPPLGLPVRPRRALGRRQDEPRQGAARARAGHPAVGLVHDAPAAPRRARRRRTTTSSTRRAFIGAQGRGRVPRARVRPRQLVRDVGDLARRAGRRPATTCCSRSTGRAPRRCARLHARTRCCIFILPPSLAVAARSGSKSAARTRPR